MSRNQKLTHVVAGRTIGSASATAGLLTITFTDDSKMEITIAGEAPVISAGKTVRTVNQAATELGLLFSDESLVTIALAAETSSVMLRSGSGALEYAD